MLGIIILIVVGRQFYELAKKYEQNTAWVYPILGIVSYYAGGFIGGVIIAIFLELTGSGSIELMSDITLTILSIVLGALSCWGFYQLLKKSWKKKFEEQERLKPKISDIGKSEEDEKPKEDFLIGNKDLGDLTKKKKDDEGWRF